MDFELPVSAIAQIKVLGIGGGGNNAPATAAPGN